MKAKRMNQSFKQLFLGLYSMVVVDKDTDPREMELLYQIGRDYGVTNDEINDAIINSNAGLYTPEKLDDKIQFLYQLALIAWANGEVIDAERELLKQTARRFGFLEENLDGITDYLLEQAKAGVPVEDVIKETTDN